jgi:hypothetical protein
MGPWASGAVFYLHNGFILLGIFNLLHHHERLFQAVDEIIVSSLIVSTGLILVPFFFT